MGETDLIYFSDLHRAIALRQASFEELALEVFRYQAKYNSLYANFLAHLRCRVEAIRDYRQIPCLPISCFKHHLIQTGHWQPECLFGSSGTSQTGQSRHALRSSAWYKQLCRVCWQAAYGAEPADFTFLALLPSYLERPDSSLVYMLQGFIGANIQGLGDFFLYNTQDLERALEDCLQNDRKTVLWGVSYALLDLAEAWFGRDLSSIIVLETGGMKGRRAEWPKFKLHEHLQNAWHLPAVHSEYGMTELFSQVYAPAQGRFFDSPYLRLHLRDVYDPLSSAPEGKSGGINAIDLGNVDTCAFIATEDLGRPSPLGGIEVLGRMDGAEIRGCNLMYEL